MRRWIVAVAMVLAATALAAAQDKPPATAAPAPATAPAPPKKPLTTEQAADAVLAAVAAKDDAKLKDLAAKDDPDPWLVADELCARSQFDAADAFANAAPRVDVEKLPAYVAEQRAHPTADAVRNWAASADDALRANKAPEVVSIADVALQAHLDVASIRLCFAKATALRSTSLERRRAAFDEVAHAAEQLGWLALASEALRQAATVTSLWNLGVVGLAEGEFRRAMDAARRAVELISQLAGRVAEEEGARARDQFRSVYVIGAQAAAKLGEPGEAAFFLATGPAGALLESLHAREALRNSVVPVDLRAAESDARAAESSAIKNLRKSLDTGELAVISACRKELDAAQERLDDAIGRIQRSSKAAAELYPDVDSLDTMRSRLREGEAKAVGDVVLLGKDATESGLAAALAKKPRWRAVHLACHGLVDPERPMFSSLALTPSGEDDGFLTALEVFRMKCPADLVVLSACETGKGKVYKAEGIVGLTRAFMFAGAPRVLVSLWKVDDEATGALMKKFYELWNLKEGKGVPAARALRDAQTFIRSQDKWKHPRFWAAWVLWGLPE